MAEIPLHVVDASTALKWEFQDESASQQAIDLLTDFVRGRVRLIGPYQLSYEFATVVRDRVRVGKMTPKAGQDAVSDFLSYRIPLVHPNGLVSVAYEYSFRYSLSLYDSLSIVLAQIEQCPLITGDNRVIQALGVRLPIALHIEDYQRQPRER